MRIIVYTKRFSVYMTNTSFPGLSYGCIAGAAAVNRAVFRNFLPKGNTNKNSSIIMKKKHIFVLKNNF